jgi:rhodanese-related sulfurtransferase/rubrerythrin
MGITDYFRKISSWSPEEIREFIDTRSPDEYTLIDVRQPGEYVEGHLPGARLIPVGELQDHIGELDPEKTAIVYCSAGVRSRAAASILKRSGFGRVYSMEGGIRAWQGLLAEGFPESGIHWFTAAHSIDELIALAWLLEEGTREFYESIAGTCGDAEAAVLYQELAIAEDRHKDTLVRLKREISDKATEAELSAALHRQPQEKIMEGGMLLDDALAWAEKKGVREILELSISLETMSYDSYLTLQERITDERSLKIFGVLADEEKIHLRRLIGMFERKS